MLSYSGHFRNTPNYPASSSAPPFPKIYSIKWSRLKKNRRLKYQADHRSSSKQVSATLPSTPSIASKRTSKLQWRGILCQNQRSSKITVRWRNSWERNPKICSRCSPWNRWTRSQGRGTCSWNMNYSHLSSIKMQAQKRSSSIRVSNYFLSVLWRSPNRLFTRTSIRSRCRREVCRWKCCPARRASATYVRAKLCRPKKWPRVWSSTVWVKNYRLLVRSTSTTDICFRNIHPLYLLII